MTYHTTYEVPRHEPFDWADDDESWGLFVGLEQEEDESSGFVVDPESWGFFLDLEEGYTEPRLIFKWPVGVEEHNKVRYPRIELPNRPPRPSISFNTPICQLPPWWRRQKKSSCSRSFIKATEGWRAGMEAIMSTQPFAQSIRLLQDVNIIASEVMGKSGFVI